MGNRAIIKGIGTEYCKLKGYRSPEEDNYGVARLCQVIGNFFGGTLSVGIVSMPETKHMSPHTMRKYWTLGSGIYELQNWDIVTHWNYDGSVIKPEDEQCVGHNLIEALLDIDYCMPVSEQLGQDYINSKVLPVSRLRIGDNIVKEMALKNYII